MTINGYDYHFAYTVGAFCAIAELNLPKPKTLADQCKIVIQMAPIMSKAWEDKQKLEDPSYKVRYLTREEVSALSIDDVIHRLSPEVDDAVKEGTFRTVEAVPSKN